MEFSENFSHEAGEIMDSILADTELNPGVMPFPSEGLDDPKSDVFRELDQKTPSLAKMKKAGLYHAEAFEL